MDEILQVHVHIPAVQTIKLDTDGIKPKTALISLQSH